MEVALEPSALPLAASSRGVVLGFGTGGPHCVSSEHWSAESRPRAGPLAVLVPPSRRAGWRTAEHVLVLSGAPSVFSASRFNSGAC